MTMHKNINTLLLCSVIVLAGCSEFEIKNKPPVARAQVLVNGMPYDTSAPIDFAGSPIAITLDATMSSDPDGDITQYLWLDTTVSNAVRYGFADAGTPAFAGDPPPVQSPQLMLGEGEYQYSVWVTDNEKMTSEPATLSFTIVTPTMYMPDAACVTGYASAEPRCGECVCTPAAMTGCLETYQVCFENADPMFATLCSAVVACAQAKGCSGSACYMGGCMAEIDAASTYMGGTLADCAAADPGANPCAAASQLGACSSTGTCMVACN